MNKYNAFVNFFDGIKYAVLEAMCNVFGHRLYAKKYRYHFGGPYRCNRCGKTVRSL